MDDYQVRVLHYLHSIDETQKRIEEQNARMIHYLNSLANAAPKTPAAPAAPFNAMARGAR